MPLLFTAPKTPQATERTTHDDEEDNKDKDHDQEGTTHREDKAGTFYDGVYVAPPMRSTTITTVVEATASHHRHPTIAPNENAEPYPEAQLTYYNLLHHRFLLLRSIVKCTPPSTAIAALDDSHPISLPRHSKNARKEWRRLLLAVDPQTVQLACMDMDSVLGVLGIMARLLSENVKNGDAERVRRFGAWAWGLLGKCREIGQLVTEEVGEIRDLGKRAIKILGKMREEDERSRAAVPPRAQAQEDEQESEDDDDDPPDDDEPVPDQDPEPAAATSATEVPDHDMEDAGPGDSTDELEAAKARLQAKIQGGQMDESDDSSHQATETEGSPGDVALQTRAMLDMIITVVGEYYGQKDLLQAREKWESA